MSKKGFVLNTKGVGELLKSEEMYRVLERYGSNVVTSAGEGYGQKRVMSSDRVKVFVRPETADAERDNNENNTLLKCLHG